MKAEILKIAGVKSEKEFYKKFPTEEAFMKVYGKHFKKAKLGKAMSINKIDDRRNQLHQLTSFEQDVDGMIPKAQGGDDIGGFLKRVGNRNCRGKSWCGTSGGDNAGGGRGGGYDAFADNAPVTSKELTASGYDVYDKKTIKKMARELEPDFPGITPDILAMAIGEQARLRAFSYRHDDLVREAAEAAEIRKTDVNKANAKYPINQFFYDWYASKMEKDEKGKVKVPDPRGILSMYSSPKEFEELVNRNYQQRYGGATHKAQGGLTMPQPPTVMSNVNPFWAQSQFGAPAPQPGLPGGMINPTAPPPMYDPAQTGTFAQQVGASANAIGPNKALGKTNFLGKMGGVAGIANIASDIKGGFQALRQQREEEKEWEQANRVSDVQMLASQTRPEPIKREYARPEDVIVQPEQLFPTYGSGYNAAFAARNGSVLRAEDGMEIGGNPTEIQNMYNPGDLYSDLGFEPLNDSSQVKQYYGGGYIPQAQIGQNILQNVGPFARQMGNQYGNSFGNSFKQFAGSAAGRNFSTQLGSFVGNPVTRTQSAGSRIGGGIGRGLGTAIGGPIGGFVGDLAGNLIGGAFDNSAKRIAKNQERVEKNMNIMTGQNFARGLQTQFGSYMEDGGWVSHDWQPQKIAKFGDYDVEDLLRPDPMMDTLRSGGMMKAQKGRIKPLLPSNPSGYADSVIRANPNIQYYKDVLAKKAPEVSDFPGMFTESHIGGMDDSDERNPYTGTPTFLKPYLSYTNGKYIPIKGMREASEDETIPKIEFPSQYAAGVFEEEMKKRTKKHRTGGHIRQNEMSPMDQYGFGGELQTTWGGYAEPISQNPYLPGTGETVMFRGKSHSERDGKGRTGIGVKYGNDGDYSPYMEYGKDGIEDVTDVEVERGEPAVELEDTNNSSSEKFEAGGENKSMVVFGNLKIPKQFIKEIGDPTIKDEKFKTYVARKSKEEAKQNKIIEKASKKLVTLDLLTSFDKLTAAALDATMMGAHMKLKDIAEKKIKASIVQNAINETAEEYGLDADSLAKGKYKMNKEAMQETAKFGKAIKKAKNGNDPDPEDQRKYDEIMDLYEKAKRAGKRSKIAKKLQQKFHEYYPDIARDIILASPNVTAKGRGMGYRTIDDLKNAPIEDILASNVDEYFGPRTEQYIASLKNRPTKLYPKPKRGSIEKVTIGPIDIETIPPKPVPPLKRNPWIDAANMLIPYLLPTDQEPLDPTQLYGEMYALSSNQLEPVRAQGYRPQLLTPYDISLQDQLNEVTAQTRGLERMAQRNPALATAMPAAAAQANRAKSQILGEQMRINQAQRMGVYNQNINTLNQAQLQNLGIFDQQFVRQEQAKSNTKAVTQAALNSISDKIARNKLENRTLGIMENMYNYRFDRRGRAINMNPLVQFDVTAGGSTGRTGTGGINPDYEFTYDANGQIIGTKKRAKDDTGKNGKKVEKSRNGNIVKAIKNL